MAHRTFHDASDVEWQAWEVYPALAERRAQRERRALARPELSRRQRDAPRVGVHHELRDGWLAFRSAAERRRLAPIPGGWHLLTERGLRMLLASTVTTGQTRRLVE
jgi:hypothetical protein